jgi:fructokinase
MSESPRILCFGEVLWDCFPHGRFAGGAPFNVAYHLRRLGATPLVVSAVGKDALGDELLAYMRRRGVDTRWVAQLAHMPTGTVQVTLEPGGQPRFEITRSVSWDIIPVTDEVWSAGASCQAIVYGSLAARSWTNRVGLERLLSIEGPLRVFDVNLRPPHDDPDTVFNLALRASLLKLNDLEVARLSGLGGADGTEDLGLLGQAATALSERTGVGSICITRGERGAVFWREGKVFNSPAPDVRVRDTVGAGDAFAAALVLGLLRDDSPAGSHAALETACRLGALVASLDGAQPDYDPEPFRNQTAPSPNAA